MAAAAEYWPAAHEPVTATRPVEAQKLPASQLRQAAWAVEAWYWPAGHELHVVAPDAAAANRPAAQLEHVIAPAPEYRPAAQLPVAAPRPEDAQ